MRSLSCLLLPWLLLGCGEEAPSNTTTDTDAGTLLDKQAIAAGILPDHSDIKLSGRFERRSDIGTDKFCAVSEESGRFRVGVLSVSGSESKCEGRGLASAQGEKILVTLDGKGDCSFEASFDGNELRFPGRLPKGCDGYCSPRTSMSATSYFLVEAGNANARKTLGRDIERLCD